MVVETAMQLASSAFVNLGPIPRWYTGEGGDVSPGLEWMGIPAAAVELALICDDPDAPRPHGWVHWVVCKIPPSTVGLIDGDDRSFVQGTNDFDRLGYGGPMPPIGHGVHHYYFWLYALDSAIEANQGITKHELLDKINGHVLTQVRLIGTYERV